MTTVFIDPTIAAVRQLHASTFDAAPTLIIRDILTKQADTIHTAYQQGDKTTLFHLGSWCPSVNGQSADHIMAANLSRAEVRLAIAREYGYSDWQSVEKLMDQSLDAQFESAVELVITGDVKVLKETLIADPTLATQRSRYGHASTLLHYLGANGVESHRQITPLNCVEVAQCLLDAGADVNAHANMYGGGSSTLGLVLTSAHPANAGVTDALANALRHAGAV